MAHVPHILKLTTLQGASGVWYTYDPANLTGDKTEWWRECQLTGQTPAEFAQMLIDQFHVDHLYYNEETNFFLFSWDKSTYATKYATYINGLAKKKGFMV